MGGMHGRGHAWQGVCVVVACMVVVCVCCGGVHGRGVCVFGDVRGRGHVWWGAYMPRMPPGHSRYGRSMCRQSASYWNAFLLRIGSHCDGNGTIILVFMGRGRQHTILPNFPPNCMKLKEIRSATVVQHVMCVMT